MDGCVSACVRYHIRTPLWTFDDHSPVSDKKSTPFQSIITTFSSLLSVFLSVF